MARVYKTFGGHGVDVAEHRADDLDKFCIERVRTLPNPVVWDLGCGAGGQSFRLAAAGALVQAVDIYDFSAQFISRLEEYPLLQPMVHFVHSDISGFVAKAHAQVDCVLFQRTIHYLPYAEARAVLQKLASLTTDSLYISVTGIDSAVGDRYAGREVPIADRFHALDTEQAERFSLFKPVCLYTPEEFTALLQDSGWKIERQWESAFGNSKAVCQVAD